jgi:hypothetical protein
MNMWRKTMGDQRGIAAPLAMYTLVLLSVLLLAFVSMAAQEPQVSRNLSDMTQARYAADAGVEWAFDTMVATPNWSTIIQGSGGPCLSTPMVSNQTLPGLTAAFGTYTVVARNDTCNGDTAITGQATVDVAPGSPTVDNNGILILTSTGTVNGVTRTIQVVVRRLQLPPFPGAVNEPGLQADTYDSSAVFQFDGRDYNRDGTLGAGPMKYGIATLPGTQTNLGITYEANAESPFNTAAKRANVIGLQDPIHALVDPPGPGTSRTGRDAIAASSELNTTNLTAFLNALAAFPGTNVIQSTMACPMVMTSSGTANLPTLTNGCGVNQPINLGTTSAPTLTYFRGELDASSAFVGLRLQGGGTIQGAGILVVEDGDLSVNVTNLRWDGVVFVVGRYVGAGFRAGSNSTLYGGLVSMEAVWNEAPGYYEFLNQANTLTIRTSKQNIDMVQGMRALYRISSWREL